MTATDLTALLAADLSQKENRLVLSDALEEAGRDEEAALCRKLSKHIYAEKKGVVEDTKNVYYESCPRGFSNEYTVYVAPRSWAKRLEAAFPDARPINRKTAIRLGWSRPREAGRDNEQWWGGFENQYYEYFDDSDLYNSLRGCRIATVRAIEVVEAQKDAEDAYHREMLLEDYE